MYLRNFSRREFLTASAAAAGSAAAIWSALADPGAAAAQSVGVKTADLPNLTIKEVKMYNVDVSNLRRLNSPENGEIISIVTESGIEGNYTVGNRGTTPGWVDWAKPALVGKNVLELLGSLTATSGFRGASFSGGRAGGGGGRAGAGAGAGGGAGARGGAGGGGGRGGARGGAPRGNFLAAPTFNSGAQGAWPNLYTAQADIALWDLLGKAVNRPIYKILGGTKDRMIAYGSSQHLANIEDYIPDLQKCKALGMKCYKIHPGNGQRRSGPPIPSYLGHMEEIKTVRTEAGDDYLLMHDPVQRYTRFEAMKVGRLLDELGYISFEDPIRSSDMEGLVELAKNLDTPLLVGEFLYSIDDFARYIDAGAMDVVRFIADNNGGISGSMRVGLLADSFGLECAPHNWGNVYDIAVHFQLELALPNSYWFEMPMTPDLADRPYQKEKFRPNADGYVVANNLPGLGCPLDHDGLDKMIQKVDRGTA